MKTKVQISCAITWQLICVFVFAYAKSWFSHNEAYMTMKDIGPMTCDHNAGCSELESNVVWNS